MGHALVCTICGLWLCVSSWSWVQARVASLLYVTTMWILVYVESMPMLVCVVRLWKQRAQRQRHQDQGK